MDVQEYTHWHVIRTVELGAARDDVWEVIGGFYTLHLWHPDITLTEMPPGQMQTREIRRLLSFPPPETQTTEELVSMDNDDCHYTYKWHAGAWGEKVRNYHASLRVLAVDLDRSMVQWEGEFDYPTDALSAFYENGFRALLERFPLKAKE